MRFDPDDEALYRRWQLCRAFRCLPQAGGLPDQNPWDMEKLRILESWEQADERAQGGLLLKMLFMRRSSV